MLAKERQNKIIEMMSENSGIIKMTDIVQVFHVSHETARRDLETLQDNGVVKRIYGGAILKDEQPILNEFTTRSESRKTGIKERQAIGKAAAALVKEGETVLLSSGTTVLEVAKNLKNMKNLTIVTNSLAIINELSDKPFDIYVIGGKLDTNELNMSGFMGIKALQIVYVDKLFIGAGGVTFEHGISDYSLSDMGIREEMLNRASCSILVAHSEKFGKNTFSVGLPLSKINIVVSDDQLSKDYIEGFKERNIKLILANTQ